jgi:hypothetical protein
MTTAVARAVTLAGWSAAAALLAHGGPALLVDPRWLAVALAGSLTAAAGLTITGARALDRVASARSVARGDFSRSRAPGFRRAPMGALFAAMLVCQGAAHVALALAGVHAAAGTTGALALHCALAALGALVMFAMESVLERLTGRLEQAVWHAIARLTATAPALHPRADWLPVPALAPAVVRPRGPPVHR